MEKILSVVVPTYNMEALLPRCLDSLTKDCVPSSVEVIVVNDGSKDGSLRVASEYKKLRPDLLTIIDKENGNYGSCINVALKQARGKYVKVLDADDWFSTEEFIVLHDELKKTDADVVITPFQEVIDGKKGKEWKLLSKYKDMELDADVFFSEHFFFLLPMHMVTYRVELLKRIAYTQTEGISYTDSEWVFKPMFHVKNVKTINADVYRYLLGRAGQTMDPKIIIKSLNQELIVLTSQLSYRKEFYSEVSRLNVREYIDFVVCRKCILIYTQMLIHADDESFDEKIVNKTDSLLLEYAPDLYSKVESFDSRCFVIKYWRKRKKRLPDFVRESLRGVLFLIKWMKSL